MIQLNDPNLTKHYHLLMSLQGFLICMPKTPVWQRKENIGKTARAKGIQKKKDGMKCRENPIKARANKSFFKDFSCYKSENCRILNPLRQYTLLK